MKTHCNTLYVTSQGAYLSKDGECVLVRLEDGTKARFPVHTLDGVVCFGNVGVSPFLLGHLAERDVAVSFLTAYGKFLARSQGPVSGNVLLRREQYRWADDGERSALVARCVLAGKIVNARSVLRRAVRDHADKLDAARLGDALARLDDCAARLERAQGLEMLRGVEGEAAGVYFAVFDEMVLRGGEAFRFAGRNRRPPLDRINCLLSFVYTLLAHDVRSALECVGLDPAVGFLHRDRPGRPGLALDLMEEFRSFFADRLVLSLVNREQVGPGGFTVTESGAVLMDDGTRRTVLEAYQKRKRDVLTHPFLKEKMPLGLAFHTQALLLARHVRGDLDGYPPFFWQ
ncbi:type I-C CRISPR-associated endonuclease Cas1c [Desulfocurvus vexinensis]|uniref:type I-C CRISPR-associated endonuclease Cas1c n=1 Tax=Desulfocurvus vexinensis TaxID=399548 RepID=UPI000490BCC2|nr:type I-C CRISPR-associated endonuclease Cas1c [Desulfocurvus vexinensis]